MYKFKTWKKRLRDEFDADKMTRDLKAKKDKKEKDSRKRKSDSALSSSKIVEKTKSRPKPKRPDALALLQQIETGGRPESPKVSKQEPSY